MRWEQGAGFCGVPRMAQRCSSPQGMCRYRNRCREQKDILRSQHSYSLLPCFSYLLPSSFPPSSLPLASFTATLKPADTGTRLFFPLGIRLRCRAENLIPTSAVRSAARLEFQQTEQQHTVTLCHRWKGKCLCPYTHLGAAAFSLATAWATS